MADNYQVLDSYKTIQILSQQTVQDIQYIVAETIPSQVGYAWSMPHDEWKKGPPYLVLYQIAQELENFVTYDHVVGGSPIQDLDKNGLLSDSIDLIVQYDRTGTGLPPLEGTVNIPMGIIGLEATDPSLFNASGLEPPAVTIGHEYDRLKALAGG